MGVEIACKVKLEPKKVGVVRVGGAGCAEVGGFETDVLREERGETLGKADECGLANDVLWFSERRVPHIEKGGYWARKCV